MAVTTITNRGMSTATWIRPLLKRSASNVHRVRAESLVLRRVKAKANRVKRGRLVTRIRHVQLDRHVSLAWRKTKRCLQVNPAR